MMDTSQANNIENEVEAGLDYLLGLFKAADQLFWSRTITTKSTGGRQQVVESRNQALAYFKASGYRDCRINCYPKYTEYQGIQRHPPNILFVADLDRKDFKAEIILNRTLDRVIKNTSEVLNGVTPAVIWSGHGYHLILPIELSEPLELENIFPKLYKSALNRFSEVY